MATEKKNPSGISAIRNGSIAAIGTKGCPLYITGGIEWPAQTSAEFGIEKARLFIVSHHQEFISVRTKLRDTNGICQQHWFAQLLAIQSIP